MKEIESRLVGCAPGKNRIKVTWEIRNGWFWSWVTGMPRVMQTTAMYEGYSTVWRLLPECKRVSTPIESKLADIEYRLLNGPGVNGEPSL